MKNKLFIVIAAVTIIAAASCSGNAQKNEDNTSTKTTDEKASTASAPMPQGVENIVGEWELVKVFADNNGDHKVDPAEEAKAITTMQDYLKLNANGTCEYTVAHLEGRYEIITKDDRKKLVMYDRTGTETTRGRYIISVTDKELVINRIMGGSDFEVFKRK